MNSKADQPKAPESKPGSKPDAKDDLKFLPMAELQAKLGLSPDGLSQGEAPKRLTQYGPNEIKENQSVREMPHLFLGSHPVDDRSSRDPFDGSPALAGFLHHPNLHQEDTSDSFIDGHILPLAPKLGTERLGVTDCAD
jgi:hypothetical protein